MWKPHPRFLPIAVCILLSGCQGSHASPTPSGYAGEWSGTTSQSMPIAFTISPAEKVTAITVGHNFNGCFGHQTFSNLNLDTAPNVTCIPGPCPPGVSSYRSFGYGSREAGAPSTSVNGLLLSTTRAEGTVGFRDFPGCGSAIGTAWTATKR